MVCSNTFGFHDGSVIACGPDRKPSPRKIKEDNLHIDEDGVFQEYFYSPTYWHSWEPEKRSEVVAILANRLNTRRSLRELVLPELAELKAVLCDIQKRLTNIEKQPGEVSRRQSR